MSLILHKLCCRRGTPGNARWFKVQYCVLSLHPHKISLLILLILLFPLPYWTTNGPRPRCKSMGGSLKANAELSFFQKYLWWAEPSREARRIWMVIRFLVVEYYLVGLALAMGNSTSLLYALPFDVQVSSDLQGHLRHVVAPTKPHWSHRRWEPRWTVMSRVSLPSPRQDKILHDNRSHVKRWGGKRG